MNIICKNNNDITREELNELYDIYLDNIPREAKVDDHYKFIMDEDYRNKWINEIINEPNLLCCKYYNEKELIGYIIIFLKEKENYIREFEIISKYQNDGTTFKEMVKLALPFTNIQNNYTGKILHYNIDAKSAFRSLGALPKDGKYFASYDTINKMMNTVIENQYKQRPADVKRIKEIREAKEKSKD